MKKTAARTCGCSARCASSRRSRDVLHKTLNLRVVRADRQRVTVVVLLDRHDLDPKQAMEQEARAEVLVTGGPPTQGQADRAPHLRGDRDGAFLRQGRRVPAHVSAAVRTADYLE